MHQPSLPTRRRPASWVWPLRRARAARPVPAAAIGALVGLTLLLAACAAAPSGSDVVSLQSPSTASDASAAPSASVDPEDAFAAFTKCMRDHGVNVQVASGTVSTTGGVVVGGTGPAPSGDPATGAQAPQVKGNDTTPEQMQQAQTACQSLMPKPAAMDPNATPDPKLVEQMLAFSKCMRDHGVDYPDPKFEGGGITMSIGGSDSNVDPSSQKFQDAQKACGSNLPGGPVTIGAGTDSGVSTPVGPGGSVANP